jgi:hypothetical protein
MLADGGSKRKKKKRQNSDSEERSSQQQAAEKGLPLVATCLHIPPVHPSSVQLFVWSALLNLALLPRDAQGFN